MARKAYFIQGVFIQWSGGDWDIFTPGIGGKRDEYPFKALVFKRMWRLVGVMSDQYGKSTLSEIGFCNRGREFSFNKTYRNNDNPIHYHFADLSEGKDELWKGEFSGKSSGGGSAECRIVEIPRDANFRALLREIRQS